MAKYTDLVFAEAEPQAQLHAVPANEQAALYVIDEDQVVRLKHQPSVPVPTPSVSTERGVEALKQASSLSFFGEQVAPATVYRVSWGGRVGLVASREPLSWEFR